MVTMQPSCDDEKIVGEEEEEEEAAPHAFVAGTDCVSENGAYSHHAVFAETGCMSGSSATVLSDEEEDDFSFVGSSTHGATGTGGVSETESSHHADIAETGYVPGSPTTVFSDEEDDDFSFGSSIDGGMFYVHEILRPKIRKMCSRFFFSPNGLCIQKQSGFVSSPFSLTFHETDGVVSCSNSKWLVPPKACVQSG